MTELPPSCPHCTWQAVAEVREARLASITTEKEAIERRAALAESRLTVCQSERDRMAGELNQRTEPERL